MAENNLHDLGRFSGEHPKTVVPESTCQQESTVDGRNEAIRSDLQLLTEIIAEMTTLRWVVVTICRYCNAEQMVLSRTNLKCEMSLRRMGSIVSGRLPPGLCVDSA